jgi:hypothetical protein
VKVKPLRYSISLIPITQFLGRYGARWRRTIDAA